MANQSVFSVVVQKYLIEITLTDDNVETLVELSGSSQYDSRGHKFNSIVSFVKVIVVERRS